MGVLIDWGLSAILLAVVSPFAKNMVSSEVLKSIRLPQKI
jgi:hypothetical protein